MITISTLGENLLRQQGRVKKRLTQGRPDLWTLGLLKSNKRLMEKRNGKSKRES